MAEQINSQPVDQSVAKQVISNNPEKSLEVKTKIESDEDGIQYDRLVVNKIKESLISSSNDFELKEENIKVAFDLLEITGASSVEDVIDKMHSDNYNKESLDLKLNSFARALYEIAPRQDHDFVRNSVIEGPYAVENFLLLGSETTRGIGEKVVAFVTTNEELRHSMDLVDQLNNDPEFSRSRPFSLETTADILSNVRENIYRVRTNSFKDDKAKEMMEAFILQKSISRGPALDLEIKQKGYSKERLKFIEESFDKNYREAVSLADTILTEEDNSSLQVNQDNSTSNKSIIPYLKKEETWEDPSNFGAEAYKYSEYRIVTLNQENRPIDLILKIKQKGLVSVSQEYRGKLDNEENPKEKIFPFADVRGATEYFIKKYKDYKEINTAN